MKSKMEEVCDNCGEWIPAGEEVWVGRDPDPQEHTQWCAECQDSMEAAYDAKADQYEERNTQ